LTAVLVVGVEKLRRLNPADALERLSLLLSADEVVGEARISEFDEEEAKEVWDETDLPNALNAAFLEVGRLLVEEVLELGTAEVGTAKCPEAPLTRKGSMGFGSDSLGGESGSGGGSTGLVASDIACVRAPRTLAACALTSFRTRRSTADRSRLDSSVADGEAGGVRGAAAPGLVSS
jgi:hypothetical protein